MTTGRKGQGHLESLSFTYSNRRQILHILEFNKHMTHTKYMSSVNLSKECRLHDPPSVAALTVPPLSPNKHDKQFDIDTDMLSHSVLLIHARTKSASHL